MQSCLLNQESEPITLDASVISIEGEEVNIHIKTNPEIRFLRIPKSSISGSGSHLGKLTSGDMLKLYINSQTRRYTHATICAAEVQEGFILNINDAKILIRSRHDASLYEVARKDLEPVEASIYENQAIKIIKRSDGSFKCVLPREASIFISKEQQEINRLKDLMNQMEAAKDKEILDLKSQLSQVVSSRDLEIKTMLDRFAYVEFAKNDLARQVKEMFVQIQGMLTCLTGIGETLTHKERVQKFRIIQENMLQFPRLNERLYTYQDASVVEALKAEHDLAKLFHNNELKDFVFCICPICNLQSEMIQLKCKHSFCKPDLTNAIATQTGGVFLYYKNEPGAIIPFCPTCKAAISESEIKTILGDAAFEGADIKRNTRLRHAEILHGRRLCPQCNSDQSLNEFFHSHGCICRNCHLLAVLDNQLTCKICNLRISDSLISEIRILKLPCSNPDCSQFVSLQEGRPIIRCEGHSLLCRLCHQQSFNREECIQCRRQLNSDEIKILYGLYGPRCVNCCKVASQDKLYKDKHQCGCNMCIDCYFTKIDLGITRCNSCKNLLRDTPIVNCMKDGKEQFEDRTVRLECGHRYCRNCLLVEEKKAKEGGMNLNCPSCRRPILGRYYDAISYA